MKHYGDITKISGYELPVVDCITGGSPCQDLSTAGNRAGLDGERSGLFMEQIRIVKEMREHDRNSGRPVGSGIRPRYLVWENVQGAMSSPGGANRGKDFQAVLTEIARIASPDCPDVPLPKNGEWPKAGCLMGRGRDGTFSIAWRLHNAQFWNLPQRRVRLCVIGDFGGLSAPEVLFERKGLSWDSEQGSEEREEHPEEVEGSVDETSLPVGVDVYNGHITGETAVTVTEASGLPNTSGPKIMEAKTIAIEGNGARPSHSGDGYCESDVSYTLNSTEIHGVCYEESYTLKVRGGVEFDSAGKRAGKGALVQKELSGTLGVSQDQTLISVGKEETVGVVRRLTPTECSRLQGFPDGWVEIGDWTDSKGKLHKDSDSPKYKALGNSIALPFWFWLLRRISAQYERPATLGSLFDGIGGFPLCWERCNGKGTALWASEIDEFCIAVTKLRFPEQETKEVHKTDALIIENHPNDSRAKIREDNVFQTLSGRMGTGGNNTPMVMEVQNIEEE